jgi:phage shock protein B
VKSLGTILLVLVVLAVGGFIAVAMLGTLLSLPVLGLNWGMSLMPRMVSGPLLFVAGVCVILLFAFLALKALGSATASDGEGLSTDEVRLMQELNSGLSRLEERVEALETLMLDAKSGRRAAGGSGRSAGRSRRTEDRP